MIISVRLSAEEIQRVLCDYFQRHYGWTEVRPPDIQLAADERGMVAALLSKEAGDVDL